MRYCSHGAIMVLWSCVMGFVHWLLVVSISKALIFFSFLFCVVNPQLIINSFIDIRSNLIIFDFFEFHNRSQLLLLFYYYYNKPTQFLILFSYSNEIDRNETLPTIINQSTQTRGKQGTKWKDLGLRRQMNHVEG
jgi:hypothetical protein